MFKCMDGCFACCYMPPIEKEIWDRHKGSLQMEVKVTEFNGRYVPVTATTICPFLFGHECSIYEDRPQLCRDFGVTEAMPCIYVDTDGNRRNRAGRRRVAKYWAEKEKKFHGMAKQDSRSRRG